MALVPHLLPLFHLFLCCMSLMSILVHDFIIIILYAGVLQRVTYYNNYVIISRVTWYYKSASEKVFIITI